MGRAARSGEASPEALPHDLAAEGAVLGAVLIDNAAMDRITLTPEVFYREAHRHVFRAMTGMWARSVPMDLVTVTDELRRLGVLDDVGGAAYVAGLVDGVPRSVNVAYYAGIVREKALARVGVNIGRRLVSEAWAAQEPARDIIDRADRALLSALRGDGEGLVPVSASVGRIFDTIEYRMAHRDQLLGITTGFASLDELTLGWRPGNLTIVAARPSIGKTTMAVCGAVQAARRGLKMAIFSLEMSRDQLETRILSTLSGVPSMRLEIGSIGGVEHGRVAQAIEELHALPVWIDDQSRRTVLEVRRICRRQQAEHGLDGVVVDYVQLMRSTLDARTSRNEQVAEISQGLKDLSKELRVPIVVCSQLSRAATKRFDPKPRVEDLRDSGSLEQDADEIVLLHRKDHRQGGKTLCIVAKQRNGPTGEVWLWLDRDTVTFTDSPEQFEDPTPATSETGPPRRKYARPSDRPSKALKPLVDD